MVRASKGLFVLALILLRQAATADIASPATNQDMVRPWEGGIDPGICCRGAGYGVFREYRTADAARH